MSATGLDRYFRIKITSSDTKNRLEMAKLVVKQAQGLTGQHFEGKDIVIIGDSVHDIECANQLGATSIAVATGFHDRDQLSQLNPDYLFNTLSDTRQVLQAIMGNHLDSYT